MKKIKRLFILIIPLFVVGCGSLPPTRISRYDNIYNYKYFYIQPTSGITSSDGETIIFNYENVSYGLGNATHSISPSEYISSYFTKKGFIKVPRIIDSQASKTLIINYSEGDRNKNAWSSSNEVIIQIVNAFNNQLVSICGAEGVGGTDTENIRMAIDRCMQAILR